MDQKRKQAYVLLVSVLKILYALKVFISHKRRLYGGKRYIRRYYMH